MSERKVALKYVGLRRWYPNVPARDLYEDELAQYGGKAFILGLPGLYEEVKASPSRKKAESATKSEPEDDPAED